MPTTIEEKIKIANLFETYNEFVDKNQAKLEKIISLKKSLLQGMFPKPWDINPNIRIGNFKKNRNPTKLWLLCTEISIKNKNRTDLEVFSVSNKNWFIRQTEHFKDNEVASKDKSNYKIVSRNQFAYNPSRINVWSIACLKDEDAVIVSPLYNIFECSEDLDETFLEYFLKTESFDKQRRINTEISVRETLSFEWFSQIKINLPEIEEQKKIWLFFRDLDKQIKNLIKRIYLSPGARKYKTVFDLILKDEKVKISSNPFRNI